MDGRNGRKEGVAKRRRSEATKESERSPERTKNRRSDRGGRNEGVEIDT